VASLKPGTPAGFKLQRRDTLLALSVVPAQRPKVKRRKDVEHDFLER